MDLRTLYVYTTHWFMIILSGLDSGYFSSKVLCLVQVPVDAPISVVELFSYNPGTFVPKEEI